jgi:hypothetical protein
MQPTKLRPKRMNRVLPQSKLLLLPVNIELCVARATDIGDKHNFFATMLQIVLHLSLRYIWALAAWRCPKRPDHFALGDTLLKYSDNVTCDAATIRPGYSRDPV